MENHLSETLPSQLLSSFFRFTRTPWHNAPADGLSQVETDILENIWRANRHNHVLRVLDLGSILHVTSPTITQHLNSLENQGFVERNHSVSDRRTITLSITSKGEDALKNHRQKLEHDFAEFVTLMGEDDSKLMIEFFDKAQNFFSQKAKKR